MPKSKSQNLEWEDARDVKAEIKNIIKTLDFLHINPNRVFCYRTTGSKVRAYARTWSFPKIFQRALGVEAAYVIEVLSKYYDNLDADSKKGVLIHELLHIPKNFSGALVAHHGRNRNLHKDAKKMLEVYLNKTK